LSARLGEARPDRLYGEHVAGPYRELRRAYQKHRPVWQAEYEQHLNWEFTEAELEAIVAFLEGAAGQHWLEAGPRMKAYVGTNTEHLVEDIVAEVWEALVGEPAPRWPEER
jgi:hypothetical protein